MTDAGKGLTGPVYEGLMIQSDKDKKKLTESECMIRDGLARPQLYIDVVKELKARKSSLSKSSIGKDGDTSKYNKADLDWSKVRKTVMGKVTPEAKQSAKAIVSKAVSGFTVVEPKDHLAQSIVAKMKAIKKEMATLSDLNVNVGAFADTQNDILVDFARQMGVKLTD